jgi:glycosyltransferase involved in cell wall biosynthesis
VRILIATRNRTIIGGIETYVRAIIPALREQGHEIGLLYEEHDVKGDDAVSPWPDPKGPSWSAKDSELLTRLDQWKPEVVYLNGLANGDLENTLARCFPTICFQHVYTGTCISGTKCHAFPKNQECTRKLGPACLVHYLPRRCGGLNPLTMVSAYRQQRQRYHNLQEFRLLLVASRAMAKEYERHGVSQERIRIVPLFSAIPPCEQPPAPRPRTDHLLFLGRLTRLKGAQLLLESLPIVEQKLHRSLRLTVAGDGPERGHLKTYASQHNLNVHFSGWVPAAELPGLFASVDALVMPVLWPEPFGLVGLEAGGQGVPTVAFALGGITDWLIPGVTGESAPASALTAQALAGAIVRTLATDEHWQQLRIGAWNKAREYSMERHVRHLQMAFQDALA